uniref:Uncharacterized protein n=1 Tax=Timema poppense TaxID=170557 RepID=A0A7R9HDT1_TIMPO|nr:unnamed protein product [Timema poppensis]
MRVLLAAKRANSKKGVDYRGKSVTDGSENMDREWSRHYADMIGMRKVEFRGVYPYVHEGRMENKLGKNTLSAAEYYSYTDLPIIGSLAYCKSDVLDHAGTKEGSRRKFVDEEEKVSPEENCGVSTLDDGQLKALLDEAITYKCPKDREGKSDLFRLRV